jgi:hypothetical protein
MISQSYARIKNPVFLAYDISRFDSAQHWTTMAAVDSFIYNEYINEAFLYADLPFCLRQPILSYLAAVEMDFVLNYPKSERPFMTGRSAGTTFSGHPKTSMANTTRSALYAITVMMLAGVPYDPSPSARNEHAALFVAGDDVLLILDDQYRTQFEAEFWNCFTTKEVAAHGFGQRVKVLEWSYGTFCFLSRYGSITPSGDIIMCRLASRVLRGGLIAEVRSLLRNRCTVADYNTAVTSELLSWATNHRLLREYILYKIKSCPHTASTKHKLASSQYSVGNGQLTADHLDWMTRSQLSFSDIDLFCPHASSTADYVLRSLHSSPLSV